MAAVAVGRLRNPKARRAVAWTVATLAVGAFIPWRYDVQRERSWPTPFRPVWEVTAQSSRGKVFFVTSKGGPKPPCTSIT